MADTALYKETLFPGVSVVTGAAGTGTVLQTIPIGQAE